MRSPRVRTLRARASEFLRRRLLSIDMACPCDNGVARTETSHHLMKRCRGPTRARPGPGENSAAEKGVQLVIGELAGEGATDAEGAVHLGCRMNHAGFEPQGQPLV